MGFDICDDDRYVNALVNDEDESEGEERIV